VKAIKSLFDAGGAQLFDDRFWGLEWWWFDWRFQWKG